MQCVKWRNHKETMTEHFFEMLHTNNLTDCAISADGRSISAHRLILAAASPYFRVSKYSFSFKVNQVKL